MEFNSSMVNLIQEINDEPIIMVLWSTFGVFLCFILLVVILKIIQKLGLGNYFGNTFTVLSGVLMFSCALGFITQMLLLFSEVSGLRMFFIWIVMFMTYLVFAFLNKKMIIKWMSENLL
jgi:hypothetical protein